MILSVDSLPLSFTKKNGAETRYFDIPSTLRITLLVLAVPASNVLHPAALFHAETENDGGTETEEKEEGHRQLDTWVFPCEKSLAGRVVFR